AWVAITEATNENGCLITIPGSHRKSNGPLTMHCPGKNVAAEHYIPGPLMETGKAVPLPVGAGGVILLHRFNEHTAYPNRSTSIRWSFDLRYQPTHQPSGRPAFPGFVVRSQANPAGVLTDPQAWTELWQAAKARLVNREYEGVIYQDRWVGNEKLPICA
ncbi:MAG: phytanoyl-CoA dioxygenase family protein, partial [Anaerolineae bacterium]|nr:phytanoyl-CoA dioxygenase family protein [Anaerolineae bacterium]